MKKIIAISLPIVFFLVSCGGGVNETERLNAELKTKREEMEKLRKEITEIETQLASLDSTKKVSGKTVQLLTLAPASFNHSIDIQGHVDAEESVSIGAQMPGMIKRVNVQPGDKVSAGQILAELDADAMNQQLAALKIQRDLSKEIFERQQNLWNQKIGSEVQFLQVQAQYQAMEKQVAALQEQIDMTRIKAPMAGTVDHVGFKVGEMAAPGYTNIVIVNTGKLRVKAEVAEGYIAKVKTRCNVTIELPDANHKTIDAKMTYAGRIINKLNRTFNVEVAIPGNEADVVPNMVAVLKINDYKNDSAKVVPLACIQQGADGKAFVFVGVKKGDKMIAERRDITYSVTYASQAEIESGLEFGEQVITEGYADLNSGEEINVQ
jgi:membrane fusion protein, multidrug efflux system